MCTARHAATVDSITTHAVFASGPDLNKCSIAGEVVSQCASHIVSVSGPTLLRTSTPTTLLCCITLCIVEAAKCTVMVTALHRPKSKSGQIRPNRA